MIFIYSEADSDSAGAAWAASALRLVNSVFKRAISFLTLVILNGFSIADTVCANVSLVRLAFSSLRDKTAVAELFREIALKVGDRPGGYTRVIRLGNRLGDNASMAMIELVDFNEVYKSEAKTKKKSRRRGGSKVKTNISKTGDENEETLIENKPVSNEASIEESSPSDSALGRDPKED